MRRLVGLLSVFAVFALFAASCGDDEEAEAPATTAAPATTEAPATTAAPEPEPEPEPEVQDIKVALLPIIGPMPVYVAAEQGIFAEHGLNVEVVPVGNGPAIVAGVIAGEFDIGFAAMSVIANSFAEGLGVTTIAPAYFEKAPDNYVFGIMAVDGIESMEDLKGKTFAMEGFGTISELGVMARLSSVGIDPDEINFINIPIPEMEAAFAQGRIDAAFVVEPFITAIEGTGHASVISSGALGQEVVGENRVLISGFFVTEDSLAGDGADTAARFVAALEDATDAIYADIDTALVNATEYVTVPLETMQNITLPLWDKSPVPSDVQPFLDAGLATGMLEQPVDAADILP